jgi:hypothetical protein
MPSRSLEQCLESRRPEFEPGVADREVVHSFAPGAAPGERWTVTRTPSGI